MVGIDYNQIKNNPNANFYSEASATYTVDGRLTDIKTVGVRALLLGKASRKAANNAPMEGLATCLNENIIDLAEDSETNSNWNSAADAIEDENTGINWEEFDIN